MIGNKLAAPVSTQPAAAAAEPGPAAPPTTDSISHDRDPISVLILGRLAAQCDGTRTRRDVFSTDPWYSPAERRDLERRAAAGPGSAAAYRLQQLIELDREEMINER